MSVTPPFAWRGEADLRLLCTALYGGSWTAMRVDLERRLRRPLGHKIRTNIREDLEIVRQLENKAKP